MIRNVIYFGDSSMISGEECRLHFHWINTVLMFIKSIWYVVKIDYEICLHFCLEYLALEENGYWSYTLLLYLDLYPAVFVLENWDIYIYIYIYIFKHIYIYICVYIFDRLICGDLFLFWLILDWNVLS
jgi:hypothetical protein